MTPKGRRVIWGRRDLLYDPKGHCDLCCLFDLVYDSKKSQEHYSSPWPTLWTQRSRWRLWSVWPCLYLLKVMGSLEVTVTYFMTLRSRWPLWSVWLSLWPQKVTGSLEVTYTNFMTSKVTVTFVVGLTLFITLKGRRVIRGRLSLVYGPKRSSGH